MRITITYALFLLLIAAVASFGAIFQPGSWYAGLAKPSWTPPNIAFPITWGILYVLIAVAGARAWLLAQSGQRRLPFVLYGLQLGLNAAWSWLFFGLHLMVWGLADIAVMLVLIVANIFFFWRIDRLAGGLLIPYSIWVVYAASLNAGIILLNR